MALPESRTEREHNKFVEASGQSAVRVANADGSAISAGGGGGTSMVDEAAFTPGGSSLTPAGGIYNAVIDAITGAGTRVAAFAMTLYRAMHVTLHDDQGNLLASATANTDSGQRTLLVRNIAGAALRGDAVLINGTLLTPKFAVISASSSGDNAVVAAVVSKKIRVLSYDLAAAADVTAKWKSGAATDLSGPKPFGAKGGMVKNFSPAGHLETASGEALNLNLNGAVAVGGELTYIEV
jgi:hypothetical protein